ncbi:MAG: ribulose phosphate epimerase [Spirochaetes bacterium DG_61]|nr:MAG: ribulose phosphate epimerase [Spirochaetes bacterium DG_61]
MKDRGLEKLKEDVYRANIELVERGLVIYSFGNASGINRKAGIVAIKPSGVDYDKLTPENMVLVHLSGEVDSGQLNPSSDTKTHLELYRAFPDIGGVVHTHSRYATSWAQARRSLPCLGTTHADYFHGEVPCTDVISDEQILWDYEKETGALIIDTFLKGKIDYHRVKAVLVACHGPFAWGKDPQEAVFISDMLEEIARMNLMSIQLNPTAGNIKQTLLDKHYLRKHGADAYYGQKGTHQ